MSAQLLHLVITPECHLLQAHTTSFDLCFHLDSENIFHQFYGYNLGPQMNMENDPLKEADKTNPFSTSTGDHLNELRELFHSLIYKG